MLGKLRCLLIEAESPEIFGYIPKGITRDEVRAAQKNTKANHTPFQKQELFKKGIPFYTSIVGMTKPFIVKNEGGKAVFYSISGSVFGVFVDYLKAMEYFMHQYHRKANVETKYKDIEPYLKKTFFR